MMTQKVMTQNVDLFSSSKATKQATDKLNGTTNDFNSVMDNSLKPKEKAVNESNSKTNKVVENDKATKGNSNITHDETIKTKEVEDTSNSHQVVDPDNTASEETKNFDDKVKEMMGILQSTVQETLDISKEELDEMLETLGFTMLDLLNVDNLKQLVLQANGAEDITTVLTNENLATSIQDLMQAVEELQLKETFQISQEEVDAFISKNSNKETLVVIESEVLTSSENKDLNAAITDLNVSKTVVQDSDSSKTVNEKGIAIEVLKTNDNASKNTDSESSTWNDNQEEVEQPSQINTFINNLAVTSNENSLNFTDQIENVRQMQEITDQLVERIKVFIKPEQTSMELQLNPENLGKINLSVIAKNGIMTAQFTTQTEIAKETIESQMQTLRDNLNNQGLKVESIEVTVANFGFEQSNQAATGEEHQSNSQRHNKFRDDSELFNHLTEEEVLAVNIMEQNGNSIDYTA